MMSASKRLNIPLVMSYTRGMGNIASAFYKGLAAMTSKKKDIPLANGSAVFRKFFKGGQD